MYRYFFEPSKGKSCREDIEYIDFFKYHDSFTEDEIEASKIYADIFYLYDCLKFIEEHNHNLEQEKEALTSKIESGDWSEENEKNLLDQLNKDFDNKKLSKPTVSILLHKKIKDIKSEKRGKKSQSGKPSSKSTLVYKHWGYAKKLIEDGMYKSLM